MITVELVKLFEVDVRLTRPGTCSPAVYQNAAEDPDFSVVIPSGQIFVADPVVVKQVDGSLESHPANTDFVCQWFPVTIRSTDGVVFAHILTSYPNNGAINILSNSIRNANGTVFLQVPWRDRVRVVGATITAVETTSGDNVITVVGQSLCAQISAATAADIQNCLSPAQSEALLQSLFQPINVESSEGYLWGQITLPISPFIVHDIDLIDDNGPVLGSFPAPAIIRVIGEVESANHADGELVIELVNSGLQPEGIAYQQITPSTDFIDALANGRDTVALWQSGAYSPYKPNNPAVIACLDPSDALKTTLLENNIFGNKYAYTDTAGNPSIFGTTPTQRINWVNHNWSGAVPDIVIDHVHGAMLWRSFIQNGTKFDVTTGATGDSWYNWLTYISTVNLGGYNGWLPVPLVNNLPHAYACNAGESAYKNFFTSHRIDNRLQILTGESFNATRFFPFIDSSNTTWISGNAVADGADKAGGLGFRNEITNIYAIRMLTEADILALTS